MNILKNNGRIASKKIHLLADTIMETSITTAWSLTDDMKKKREEEIIDREKTAKELQKQRFGKGGDLLKKRQELIKPLQDKIYNAIKDIAQTKNLGAVFDKSSDLTMLYTNAKYDISDQVLENLGFTPASKTSDDAGGDSGSTPSPKK